MMDILKAAPRHRNNEINTDVVLPCPIVTAQTDDEKRQHRNTLAIGYGGVAMRGWLKLMVPCTEQFRLNFEYKLGFLLCGGSGDF
jgi:hypothetical protein